MFTKILVPHDFSSTADVALDVACDMSKRYDAPLSLLHVHALPGAVYAEGFMPPSPEVMVDFLAAVSSSLEKTLLRAKEKGARAPQAEARPGHAFSTIVQYARDGGYDLIVLGTHGRTGLSHALLGSVAERVVRKAHCTVLVVRSPDHKFSPP